MFNGEVVFNASVCFDGDQKMLIAQLFLQTINERMDFLHKKSKFSVPFFALLLDEENLI